MAAPQNKHMMQATSHLAWAPDLPLVTQGRTPPRRFPARVVDSRDGMALAGENKFAVTIPRAFNDGSGDSIQHDITVVRVLYVFARNDEDGRRKLGDGHFPLPAQVDYFLLAQACVHLEKRHGSEVLVEFRK